MSSKTITMKVDLSCCNECVQRMKKLLGKLKGVESSSIDVKSGIVIVSGHIDDPDNFIDMIRRKVKPVTHFSIDIDDDNVSEYKPDIVRSTSSQRSKNITKESGESSRKGGRDDGGQSKVNGYESERLRKGKGISYEKVCFSDGQQPQADHKPKPKANKKAHFSDVVFDPPLTRSTSNRRWKNSNNDPGESSNTGNRAVDDRKYRALGGQSKGHGHGSQFFHVAEGISDQHNCCRCGGGIKQFHAKEEIKRVQHFEEVHNYFPKQDFEYAHSGSRDYNVWNQQQFYNNQTVDCRAPFYRDDTRTGCWIM